MHPLEVIFDIFDRFGVANDVTCAGSFGLEVIFDIFDRFG